MRVVLTGQALALFCFTLIVPIETPLRIASVAMTGYGQEEERRRTREAGFHSHLVKPVDFDMLQELLSSLPANQSRNGQGRGKAS